jgi:hypothetical protein
MSQLSNPRPKPRRARPAHLYCRGGASSLLRLSTAAPARLPSGAALETWAQRARQMLDAQWAGQSLAAVITPLSPSPGVDSRIALAA